MKKIPLTSKDIPPGSCIRNITYLTGWFSVITCGVDALIVHASRQLKVIYFTDLINDFEIYHPIVYPNWKKCYKIEHPQEQGDPIIEHPDAN